MCTVEQELQETRSDGATRQDDDNESNRLLRLQLQQANEKIAMLEKQMLQMKQTSELLTVFYQVHNTRC